jgi:hypothetical protein
VSKYFSHIIAGVLISVLAFSQVGLNFFHSKHLEHGPVTGISIEDLPPGDAVQQHDEHCKVCSLDFAGKLYTQPNSLLFPSFDEEHLSAVQKEGDALTVASFNRDRGPPAPDFLPSI